MALLASMPPGESTAAADSLQLVVLQFSGEFLEWGLLFFVLALVAAVLGAKGIAGMSMTIAKWLIVIFVVLAIVSLLR